MKRWIKKIISAHPLKPRVYVVSFGILLFLSGSILGAITLTRSSADICIVGSSDPGGCDYHPEPTQSNPTPEQQNPEPQVTPKQIEAIPTTVPTVVQSQTVQATPSPFKQQNPCN